MIDLERATDQLVTTLGDHQPDVERVRATVRHRRQRRRATVAGALVVAALGTGLLALAGGSPSDREQVRTVPAPRPAPRWVDHSSMRFEVPTGWSVVTADWSPPDACAAEGLVLVGYATPPPAACADLPAVEVAGGGGAGNDGGARPGNPAERRQANGHPAYRDRREDVEAWSLPGLNAMLIGRNGADLDPIFATVDESARRVALDAAEASARTGRSSLPAGWRTVRSAGVAVAAPPGWRPGSSPGDATRRTPPCAQWHTEGPTVRTDVVAGTHCQPRRSWEPADGLWVLPLDGSGVDTSVRDYYLTNANGVRLRIVWDLEPTVLQVIVPPSRDRQAILIRIGLGADGRVAGSVIDSIEVDG